MIDMSRAQVLAVCRRLLPVAVVVTALGAFAQPVGADDEPVTSLPPLNDMPLDLAVFDRPFEVSSAGRNDLRLSAVEEGDEYGFTVQWFTPPSGAFGERPFASDAHLERYARPCEANLSGLCAFTVTGTEDDPQLSIRVVRRDGSLVLEHQQLIGHVLLTATAYVPSEAEEAAGQQNVAALLEQVEAYTATQ